MAWRAGFSSRRGRTWRRTLAILSPSGNEPTWFRWAVNLGPQRRVFNGTLVEPRSESSQIHLLPASKVPFLWGLGLAEDESFSLVFALLQALCEMHACHSNGELERPDWRPRGPSRALIRYRMFSFMPGFLRAVGFREDPVFCHLASGWGHVGLGFLKVWPPARWDARLDEDCARIESFPSVSFHACCK